MPLLLRHSKGRLRTGVRLEWSSAPLEWPRPSGQRRIPLLAQAQGRLAPRAGALFIYSPCPVSTTRARDPFAVLLSIFALHVSTANQERPLLWSEAHRGWDERAPLSVRIVGGAAV